MSSSSSRKARDRIPEHLFTSKLGRVLYAKDPTRFTRERIEIALERKRSILADIDRFSLPQG
ncbi:hypothetical protein [Streptomyces caniscabiei]|uniref:hypothetical protein n=1 Tax=Streptomyces caniscabiei TaxID=2746961 RepID=UPI0038F63E3A